MLVVVLVCLCGWGLKCKRRKEGISLADCLVEDGGGGVGWISRARLAAWLLLGVGAYCPVPCPVVMCVYMCMYQSKRSGNS